jgi:hypothetical protein
MMCLFSPSRVSSWFSYAKADQPNYACKTVPVLHVILVLAESFHGETVNLWWQSFPLRYDRVPAPFQSTSTVLLVVFRNSTNNTLLRSIALEA